MTREFFNRMAAGWDERSSEKNEARLAEMARRLTLTPGSAVLDIGTGTGVFMPFILRQIGSRGQVVALDFAQNMLARARAKRFDGQISYVCADVTRLPLCHEVFDAVVCYSSFPHFKGKAAAMKEISRVLKKGGRLFVCHTSSRLTINDVHRGIPEVAGDVIPERPEMELWLQQAGLAEIIIEDNRDDYLCSARKPDLAFSGIKDCYEPSARKLAEMPADGSTGSP